MITLFGQVLRTWSARAAFTIALTVFDRPPVHPDADRVVGDFTDIVLLSMPVPAPESDLAAAARAVAGSLFEALDHRAVSGAEVARLWMQEHGMTTGAAMSTVVTSTIDLPGPDGGPNLPGQPPLLGELRYAITQTPQVTLDCQLGQIAGELRITWDYVADAFPPGLIEAMWAAFRAPARGRRRVQRAAPLD